MRFIPALLAPLALALSGCATTSQTALADAPAPTVAGAVSSADPRATAAGEAILAQGGSAVDAAIAVMLALTVVEPMMVGVLGGGVAHLRMADGRHSVVDGLSTAPAAARDRCAAP